MSEDVKPKPVMSNEAALATIAARGWRIGMPQGITFGTTHSDERLAKAVAKRARRAAKHRKELK